MSYLRKYRKIGQTYLSEFESIRINGKIVQRFIRYIGREANEKTILSYSISEDEITSVNFFSAVSFLFMDCRKRTRACVRRCGALDCFSAADYRSCFCMDMEVRKKRIGLKFIKNFAAVIVRMKPHVPYQCIILKILKKPRMDTNKH